MNNHNLFLLSSVFDSHQDVCSCRLYWQVLDLFGPDNDQYPISP